MSIGTCLAFFVGVYDVDPQNKDETAFATRNIRVGVLSVLYSAIAFGMLFAEPVTFTAVNIFVGLVLGTGFTALLTVMAVGHRCLQRGKPFKYRMQFLNMPWVALIWLLLCGRFIEIFA